MKVRDLIESLKTMPQDAEVFHLWDGAARTAIDLVYVARSGAVITSEFDMVCYYTEDRPEDAPTREQENYWKTPKVP